MIDYPEIKFASSVTGRIKKIRLYVLSLQMVLITTLLPLLMPRSRDLRGVWLSFPCFAWEWRPPSIEPHLSIRSLHLHCHTWAAWHQLLLYAFPRKAWERWCAQCRPGALVAGNVDQFNVNWVCKQRDRPERFQ